LVTIIVREEYLTEDTLVLNMGYIKDKEVSFSIVNHRDIKFKSFPDIRTGFHFSISVRDGVCDHISSCINRDINIILDSEFLGDALSMEYSAAAI
jgi:hypothetical protein